ncbi:MAG: type II toxin-antitoxin system mRNA interferase toxin, RelE/StbE family [Candidatus Pacearchaeota archaeon]|nr:type II toxin-antitoxin system mRNA interferase toxin, RelE/StbE family [Candidatus Pacearchaeota archaeon]
MEILLTREFEKYYAKLPASIQKKAEKQTELFSENPFYPSLHTEKLNPKGREVWSFRIDRQYRIFFRFLAANRVLFFTVGPHEWIYNLKF